MTTITILLVDDQEELLDITRLFLEKSGEIRVDTTTSAITALEMLKEKKYDAIVSDYEMPAMDGIEFLRTIKRAGVEKPFIIFTGRSREDIVIEALNSGADFYLQKGSEPKVQFAELRNMIRQAVMRKRVEEALIQSETNYRTLVECTDDSIYMVDKRGRYLFVNSHHRGRIGIDSDDCQKYYYEDLHDEGETERFLNLVREVIRTGESLKDEYDKDGRWFLRTISPVKNDILDLTIAVTVISTEITRVRKLEHEVSSLEAQYRTLVESLHDSVYIVDPDCRYLFMNSHHQKRLGISGDGYRLTHYHDLHDSEASARFSTWIRKVVESRKSCIETYTADERIFVRTFSPIQQDTDADVEAIVVISIEPADRTGRSE